MSRPGAYRVANRLHRDRPRRRGDLAVPGLLDGQHRVQAGCRHVHRDAAVHPEAPDAGELPQGRRRPGVLDRAAQQRDRRRRDRRRSRWSSRSWPRWRSPGSASPVAGSFLFADHGGADGAAGRDRDSAVPDAVVAATRRHAARSDRRLPGLLVAVRGVDAARIHRQRAAGTGRGGDGRRLHAGSVRSAGWCCRWCFRVCISTSIFTDDPGLERIPADLLHHLGQQELHAAAVADPLHALRGRAVRPADGRLDADRRTGDHLLHDHPEAGRQRSDRRGR